MHTKEKENKYVEWQNRAFHFYLAARLLYLNQHIVTADFCAQQSLELMLKATLLYHDKSFVPESVNHRFKSMINTLKNKVKKSEHVNIPEYFYYEHQYQSFTRYPSNREGLFQPENMLNDLDKCFYDLLS
jgi:HEPN domain-containing protein